MVWPIACDPNAAREAIDKGSRIGNCNEIEKQRIRVGRQALVGTPLAVRASAGVEPTTHIVILAVAS
jgi:hypothetical protein